MTMLKLGMYIAAAFIGAIALFLGVIVTIAAVRSGQIQFSYGAGARLVTEVVTKAADETRFWQLVGLLGAVPAFVGALVMRWGWNGLQR